MDAKSTVRLTARQRHAAMLLAEGVSISSAVKKLGINRTTVYNWKKLPAFEALVNQMQEEAISAGSARMAGLSVEAAGTLKQLLKSKNERIRLTAVRAVFDYLPRIQIAPSAVEDAVARRNGTSPVGHDQEYIRTIRTALGFSRDQTPHVAVGSAKTEVSGPDADMVDAKS
jgi:transposase